MATRSYIGIRNLDNTVDYIYCHWDGYPEHNGQILTEHYTTVDRVRELLDLGDLSVLGKFIGEKQDFNNRTVDCCLAYGRDRNEPNTKYATAYQLSDLLDGGVSYIYIFDGDYWECYDAYDLNRQIKLYNTKEAE